MTPAEFRALVARVEGGYNPTVLDYRACTEAQCSVLVGVEKRRLARQVMLLSLPAATASGAGLAYRRRKGKHA